MKNECLLGCCGIATAFDHSAAKGRAQVFDLIAQTGVQYKVKAQHKVGISRAQLSAPIMLQLIQGSDHPDSRKKPKKPSSPARETYKSTPETLPARMSGRLNEILHKKFRTAPS